MSWSMSRRPPGRRALKVVPLLALVVVLVGSAPASASTTVGSGSLNTSGSGQVECDAAPCVLIQDKIDGAYVAPPAGVITSWSVRNAAGTVALRVLRPRGALVPGQLHATNVSESADEEASGGDSVAQTFLTRQRVAAGDYFGITLQSGSRIGAYGGDGDDPLFEVTSLAADVEDTSADQFEQLLQVEVEPDADSDGYGDETQDGCPTNGSTAGPCPAPPPPPPGPAPPQVDPFAAVRTTGPRMTLSPRSSRLAKDGSLRLTVKNGAGVAVKGKVSLSSTAAKLARRTAIVVGSKRFSVSANGSATVKIKLSGKARRALRRRKLALTALTTAQAAQGKRSTRKDKLTVRRYKKGRRKAPPKGRNGSYEGCFSDRSYGENPDLPCGGGNYAVRFEVANGVVQNFRVLSVHATCNRGPGTSGPFDPVATAPLNAGGDFFSRSQRVGTTELEDFFEYSGKVNENGTAAGYLKRYHAWYQRGGDDFCSSGTRPWTAAQR